jgi:multidrug transporter EmrE-like cation transporter
MIQLHKILTPHVAIAVIFGGIFVLTQLMLYLIFRAHVNYIQWGGMALILIGILLVAFCVTPPEIS